MWKCLERNSSGMVRTSSECFRVHVGKIQMNCTTTNSPIAKLFLYGQSVSDGTSVHVLERMRLAGKGQKQILTPFPAFFGIASAYKTQRHWGKRQISTKAMPLKQSWYTGASATYLDANPPCHTCFTLWSYILLARGRSALQQTDCYKLKIGTSNITTMSNM